MSTFYHGTQTKFVLGTSPYYAQQMPTGKTAGTRGQDKVQTLAVVEPETKYHAQDNLPSLDVDLKQIKKVAAADVVNSLAARVKKPPRAKRVRIAASSIPP